MTQILRYFRRLFWLYPLLAITPVRAEADSNQLKDLVTNNFKEVADAAKLRTGADTDKLSPLDLFGLYFELAIGFVGVLFIAQVIFGGILWMNAGGNEEKIQKARNKIINGAIGAVIMFSAYLITFFVLSQVTQQIGVEF